MNNVSLVGRLVRDVDLDYTQNGKAVGKFDLAVQRPYKNESGEFEADFIRCTVWGKRAESLAEYQKKGARVGVIGAILTGSYDDQDGKKVYTVEVNVSQV